jgi:SET domain-containing protein
MKRIVVRNSPTHGRGLFAQKTIAVGEYVLEYLGERISPEEAANRLTASIDDPFHTFFFGLSDGRLIDGAVNGNSARWINHSCEPNCEAEEGDGRVFIRALRDLLPGDELFIDYGLTLESRQTAARRREYACMCGAKSCRQTMLAPKRGRARAVTPEREEAALAPV